MLHVNNVILTSLWELDFVLAIFVLAIFAAILDFAEFFFTFQPVSKTIHFSTYVPSINIVEKVNDFFLTAPLSGQVDRQAISLVRVDLIRQCWVILNKQA